MDTRHFLTLLDFSPEELTHVVSRAAELKRLHRAGTAWRPLEGKTLAMVFELNSTRTRVAFEVGMHQLGGHAICSLRRTRRSPATSRSRTRRACSGRWSTW